MCIDSLVITETAFGGCRVRLCFLLSKIFICVVNDNNLQDKGRNVRTLPPSPWSDRVRMYSRPCAACIDTLRRFNQW